MRYADGGGLTAQGRPRREDVRLQAARLFEQDVDADQIAKTLRVSTKPVYQWRRAWRSGADAALASKGPAGSGCMLDEQQLVRLCAALRACAGTGLWRTRRRWRRAHAAYCRPDRRHAGQGAGEQAWPDAESGIPVTGVARSRVPYSHPRGAGRGRCHLPGAWDQGVATT